MSEVAILKMQSNPIAQLYHNTGDNEKLERIASFSDTFKPKVPSYTTQQYHDKIMQMAYGE